MDIISFITGFAVAGFIGTIIEYILTVKKDREIKSLQKEFVGATNQMSAAYKIPIIIYKDAKEFKFPLGSTNIKDDLQKAKDYATKNDCYVDFEINGCSLQVFEGIPIKLLIKEYNDYMKKEKK